MKTRQRPKQKPRTSILALLMVPLSLLSLLAGCGDRPSDYVNSDGQTDMTDPGTTPGPVGSSATCTLDEILGDAGDISIEFSTDDPDGDTVTIFIQYSTNTGATFQLCTGAAGNNFPNAGTGLSTSSGALFLWDSVADLGTGQVSVRIRVTVADASNPASNCDSDDFTLNDGGGGNPIPAPPSCVLDAPIAGAVLSGDIPVSFTLSDDDDATTADITAEFSIDGGVTFSVATLSTATPEGLTGLTTSMSGAPHSIVWDSRTDIPDQDATPEMNVLFGLVPEDDDGAGMPCDSGVFTVDGTAPSNTTPSCSITSPAGGETLTGDVTLDYVLTDAEQLIGDVTVSFSTDGGTSFAVATETVGGVSEGSTMLAMSPAGTMHTFIWDSSTDVPGQQMATAMNVRLRIRPSDGSLIGMPCDTMDFNLEAPRTLMAGSMEVLSDTSAAAFNDTACCGAFASPILLTDLGGTQQLRVEVDLLPSPIDEDVAAGSNTWGTTTYVLADPTVATASVDGLVTAEATGANRCTTLTITFTPDGVRAMGAPEVRDIACCVDLGGIDDAQRAGPDATPGTADDLLAVGDLDCDFPASASAAPVGVGGTFEVRVTVNTGTLVLGAWGIDLMFDNTILTIDDVRADMGVEDSRTFPGMTIVPNPENPLGRLRAGGVDAASTRAGIFDICTIHCNAIGSGTSMWMLTVDDLEENVSPPQDIGGATPRAAIAGSGAIQIP